MSARTKLNVACVNGGLVISVLLALIAGSWSVFLAALVVTLAGSLHAGEIRLSRRAR